MIITIRRRFARLEYEYSQHAVDQSIRRRILTHEVKEVIEVDEVIENYPADKYGPSCLIFGLTADRRPLHMHCSYPERNPVKVITLYQPDPNEWADFRRRRPQ